MGDKTDSSGWTGDYPAKAHYVLASERERAVHRRVAKLVIAGVAVIVAAALVWQVLR